MSDLGPGFHPIWSPDSTRLLISINRGDGGFAILDPSDPGRTTTLRTTGWAAAWSPDGDQILFNDAGLTASSG